MWNKLAEMMQDPSFKRLGWALFITVLLHFFLLGKFHLLLPNNQPVIHTIEARLQMPETAAKSSEAEKPAAQEEMPAKEFLALVKDKSKLVELDSKLASRSVNEGFSGGEKKRNEIFQMAMLQPKLAILDETDSGLDIDALRIVANGVNKLKSKENATILITHYQRLLDYIVPDVVHILYNGKIVKSGPKELALELEEKGYDFIKEALGA